MDSFKYLGLVLSKEAGLEKAVKVVMTEAWNNDRALVEKLGTKECHGS